ncbi:class I SAM-dependent methyltransferase [Frankia sp. AgPm24]|uniref:class I SAM-dependent methyltransferase n=1 Tax=Frankia sp. AgPm24 TaxID=631128 RepID=UPI0035B44B74
MIEDAVTELQSRQARTVVDLGCGDGRNLAVLLDAGLNALGVDIAPTGLAHARRIVRQRGFLLHADATRVPLIDASVDAVSCFDVFGQVADPADLVAEARRLLRAGGLFIANAFTIEDGTYGEGVANRGAHLRLPGHFFSDTTPRMRWRHCSRTGKFSISDGSHGTTRRMGTSDPIHTGTITGLSMRPH